MGWISYIEDIITRFDQRVVNFDHQVEGLEQRLRDDHRKLPLVSSLMKYIDEEAWVESILPELQKSVQDFRKPIQDAIAVRNEFEKLINYAADPEVNFAEKAIRERRKRIISCSPAHGQTELVESIT